MKPWISYDKRLRPSFLHIVCLLLCFGAMKTLIWSGRHIRSFRNPLEAVKIYSPDANHRLPTSLSFENRQYTPLIIHLSADRSYSNLWNFVTSETSLLTESYLRELVSFGSVYKSVDITHLKPHRLTEDGYSESVSEGSYFCIYANPKRYSAASSTDWQSTVVYEDEHIVCINKPAAVPCSAGVDNMIENVLHQISLYSNLTETVAPPRGLYLTGRLDVCTSGLLVLAKSSKVAAVINELHSSRQISKRYLVLCSGKRAIPLGILRHYFCKSKVGHKNSKPSLLRTEIKSINRTEETWQVAELRVLRCEKLDNFSYSTIRSDDDIFECEVELITVDDTKLFLVIKIH